MKANHIALVNTIIRIVLTSCLTMVPFAKRRLHQAAQLSLLSTSLYALVTCPYSKVEESFQLQATHDLYYLGIFPAMNTELLPYDHLSYPGVVPRTFMGPLILASFCRLLTFVCHPCINLADYPMVIMFLARLFLLSFHLHAWFRLAKIVGGYKGSYLLLITAVQFHVPFYASRMLPNTFALVVVLHAYADWISGNVDRAAAGLVAATTVFRCDLLLLLFTCGLTWLIRGDMSILRALKIGVSTGISCLAIIIPYDSHMWRQWVWAEGQVFYYNTVLGKSKDWGVSPWHWYLSTALPKALLLTLLLIPIGIFLVPELLLNAIQQPKKTHWPHIVDTSILQYFLPILGFIALYSCLGHKEMRFLFPVLPILNLVGAAGMTRLHLLTFPTKDKTTNVWNKLFWCCGIACIVLTFLASTAFVMVSQKNYPGGNALAMLWPTKEKVTVYIDNAAAMSGVSLFGQRHVQNQFPLVEFVKAGYEQKHDKKEINFSDFDYVLSEIEIMGMRVIGVAQGYPRLDIKRLRIETRDAIHLNAQLDLENSPEY